MKTIPLFCLIAASLWLSTGGGASAQDAQRSDAQGQDVCATERRNVPDHAEISDAVPPVDTETAEAIPDAAPEPAESGVTSTLQGDSSSEAWVSAHGSTALDRSGGDCTVIIGE